MSEMADLKKELMRVKNDIRGEMLEDAPDLGDLRELISRKSDIRAEIEVLRLEGRLAMREVLTEEQRDKMLMVRHGRRGPRGDGSDFRRGSMGRGMGRGMMPRRQVGPGGQIGEINFDEDELECRVLDCVWWEE